MKELSMEEKAKRYDKALDDAKAIHKVIKKDLKPVIEQIFPELKESEDEQIRKRIIQSLHGDVLDMEETNKAIAWLEKQGKQTDIANKEYWRGYREGKQEILDKYAELKKQGEQKSVDKVESKFHEGDFIKHNKANIICKVILVNSGSYYVEGIVTRAESELFYAEENFHLWTIEDAKDGDVLRLGDVIAIFKKYVGQEKCICYCSFCDNCYCSSCNNVGFEIPIENGEDNVYGCTNTTPATKEERDLLFAKMKEAGYEWDADEKVLNKVIIYEQK